MIKRYMVVLACNVVAVSVLSGFTLASTITTTVNGTANPWLAGMPNGSTAQDGDTAPDHSPVEVKGVSLAYGGYLTFSVTGAVSMDPNDDPNGPDGGGVGWSTAEGQGVNGIADVKAPFNSLVGVFLDDHTTIPPSPLDFSTAESLDYNQLHPKAYQVFFIGDGLTSTGSTQKIYIPAGATRFFLGTMDSGHYNNYGSFEVTVAVTDVSGCFSLKDFPAANRKVILKQSLVANQVTQTDAQGCYVFENADHSKPFTVTIQGDWKPASSPTGVVADAETTSTVNLEWQYAPTDVTLFKIFRKKGATGTWRLIKSTGPEDRSYSDTTAVGNDSTAYQYRIQGCNTAGCSAATEPVDVTQPTP